MSLQLNSVMVGILVGKNLTSSIETSATSSSSVSCNFCSEPLLLLLLGRRDVVDFEERLVGRFSSDFINSSKSLKKDQHITFSEIKSMHQSIEVIIIK